LTAAALVLAAGGSRRLGQPKQLLDWGGRPLLERVVAAVHAWPVSPVVVVLGAHADDILERVDLGEALVVVNPEWEEGIASSLRVGFDLLAREVTAHWAFVALGDQPVKSWYGLRTLIQQFGAGEVPVHLQRDGQTLNVLLTPRQMETGGDYLIGIAPHHATTFKRFGPGDAVHAGAARTMELIDLTLVFIQKMFAGAVSTSNIGGPITVVQIAGQAAQTDISSILSVLAFLSIQLGILNLLPIPILDGGHLFFASFELIFRRPLSLRAREVAQQIGLALLVMLMVLAFYNDIVRLFGS